MTNRDLAKKQDRRVSSLTGFRIRPNSGAVRGYKGDLGGTDILLETKTGYNSNNPGYLTIRQDWIDKAKQQALAMGKSYWALVLSPDGETDYVVTEYSQLVLLLGDNSLDLEPLSGPYETKRTISILIEDLDSALYHRRMAKKTPVVRKVLDPSGLGLVIMYLEDFMRIYNERELYTV